MSSHSHTRLFSKTLEQVHKEYDEAHAAYNELFDAKRAAVSGEMNTGGFSAGMINQFAARDWIKNKPTSAPVVSGFMPPGAPAPAPPIVPPGVPAPAPAPPGVDLVPTANNAIVVSPGPSDAELFAADFNRIKRPPAMIEMLKLKFGELFSDMEMSEDDLDQALQTFEENEAMAPPTRDEYERFLSDRVVSDQAQLDRILGLYAGYEDPPNSDNKFLLRLDGGNPVFNISGRKTPVVFGATSLRSDLHQGSLLSTRGIIKLISTDFGNPLQVGRLTYERPEDPSSLTSSELSLVEYYVRVNKGSSTKLGKWLHARFNEELFIKIDDNDAPNIGEGVQAPKSKAAKPQKQSHRFVYYNSKKDLVDRFNVLVGQVMAGNTSYDVRNEIIQISDEMKRQGVITKEKYITIAKRFSVSQV